MLHMAARFNEIMIVDEKSLRDKIHVIRGQQVMLDFDLAEIYGYQTNKLNPARQSTTGFAIKQTHRDSAAVGRVFI